MKTLIYKIKFYFLRKITWKSLNFAARRQLIRAFSYAPGKAKKVVFLRTLNNTLSPSDWRHFEFIGFRPVFTSHSTGYSFDAKYNEID